MKKITLSVAAIALAMSSYGQSKHVEFTEDSIITSKQAIKAQKVHKNLYEIVIRAEDMIFQLDLDSDSGFILDGMSGFYKELLSEIIKLAAKTEINGRDIDYQGYFPCNNCDEID